MMTFAIFAIVSKLRIKTSPALSRIAALTFGVYLCHFFFVQCAYDAIDFLWLDGSSRLRENSVDGLPSVRRFALPCLAAEPQQVDAQEHHVKDPDICLHGRCGTSETVPQRFLFGKAFFRGDSKGCGVV